MLLLLLLLRAGAIHKYREGLIIHLEQQPQAGRRSCRPPGVPTHTLGSAAAYGWHLRKIKISKIIVYFFT